MYRYKPYHIVQEMQVKEKNQLKKISIARVGGSVDQLKDSSARASSRMYFTIL